MPNTYRGQTPFRALGREMFLVYRTQEIAAMQAALGFCRPEPLTFKPETEEVPALNLKRDEAGKLLDPPQHVLDADGLRLAALDADGKPLMRIVIVDAQEIHKRKIAAFDACLQRPLIKDLPLFIRCGLALWERDNGAFAKGEFDQLLEEIGFLGLADLHQKALFNGYHVAVPEDESRGDDDEEDDDPNAGSPAPASRT